MVRDPIAVVQAAVDLEQAAREADALLTEINEGDKALGDRRLRLGRILLDVRKQFPERGPKAKGWGDFLAARKLEQRTARRYLALADHYERNPHESRPIAEVYGSFWGKEVSDSLSEIYPAQVATPAPGPQIFTAAQQALTLVLPPSNDRGDLWRRFLDGKLTRPELDDRKGWPPAQLAEDEETRKAHQAACKAARRAGRTDPPPPPMPIGWLTASGTDPVQAARKALEAAEALGRDTFTKPALMIGAVADKLRKAGHHIPAGQEGAVFRAYTDARKLAIGARLRGEPAAAAPAEVPRPVPYVPLFQEGPGPALADKPAICAKTQNGEIVDGEHCPVCELDECEDPDACLRTLEREDELLKVGEALAAPAPPADVLGVLTGWVGTLTGERRAEVGAELLRLAAELGAVQVGEVAREELEALREQVAELRYQAQRATLAAEVAEDGRKAMETELRAVEADLRRLRSEMQDEGAADAPAPKRARKGRKETE